MQKKLYNIISIAVFVLVVSGAGYYFYSQRQQPTEDTVVVSDTESFFTLVNYDDAIPQEKVEDLTNRFTIFKERVIQNEKDILSWSKMGVIKKAFNDFDGAEAIWLHASDLDPFNSFTFANLADLYHYFKKDSQKAKKYYKLAIKNDLTNEQLYIEYARLLFLQMNDPKLAETVLTDAIDTIPQAFGARVSLADIYERQGMIGKAIEQIQQLADEYPDNNAVKEELARLKKLQ